MLVRLSPSVVFRTFAIYRPPPSSTNKLTYDNFVADFPTLLESVTIDQHQFVLMGDFNIHVDDKTDRDARKFLDILDTFDLQQHVKGATHRSGHTLDLLISRKVDHPIVAMDVVPGLPSDHSAVLTTLNFVSPATSKKRITCRKLRNMWFSLGMTYKPHCLHFLQPKMHLTWQNNTTSY